jgi:hypothetical protein
MKEQQEFLERYDLTERQFLGIDKIEGSLHLYRLTSIPKGFNPTVVGRLRVCHERT